MSGSLSVTIDANGIAAPSYSNVLSQVQSLMQGIYGADLYIDNDSQDGQFLALLAKVIHDCNSAAIATYNAFSPSSAVGNGLNSVVKVNGITRLVATNSQVVVEIEGAVGAPIINGVITDQAQVARWLLPPLVMIGLSGTVTVTAIASLPGNTQAPPGTLTGILTPTRGWLTVSNPAAAIPGAPLESDAALRQRQQSSVALPALALPEGLQGALANVPGVLSVKLYENDDPATDSNGIPGNTVAAVIAGGNLQTLADVIRLKKSQGCGTYGSIHEVSFDSYGVPHPINFSAPIEVPVSMLIQLKPLPGYKAPTGTNIIAAILAYTGQSGIAGDPVYVSRLLGPAALTPAAGGNTFDILGIQLSRAGGAPDQYGNLTMAWNEQAQFDPALINVITI